MKKLACILKGYPRLSETFITQEILALKQAGIELHIYSLRYPTDQKTHPGHELIRAPVTYLPEYLYREPLRLARGLFGQLFSQRFFGAFRQFAKDLMRDPTPNRIRRFGQALVLANEISPHLNWLYVHFLHTPASVGRYAALLTGLPWSCSAHAKDIWTSPVWDMREKLAEMEWLVTCTDTNRTYLQSLAADRSKVSLLYHGLDSTRFIAPDRRSSATGRDTAEEVVILSVGRAVPKKGYDVLLHALATLPPSLYWKFVHIGGGGLSASLKQLGETLGVAHRIQWRGAMHAGEVIAAYAAADIFVLPAKIGEDGDRDGLPNVLMEAMAMELPCLSTTISGIPELIDHGSNGWLVAQASPDELAGALTTLIENAELRHTLGRAGRLKVLNSFSLRNNIQPLIKRFS